MNTDPQQPEKDPFADAELIHSYTRAQAIADGVLIDVTETAKEAGFKFPVALTAAVWAEYVRVPEGVEGQDEKGRLWDILTILRYSIRNAIDAGRELRFHLHVRNDNRDAEPPLVTLKSVCGPGDEGEGTVTIMLLTED